MGQRYNEVMATLSAPGLQELRGACPAPSPCAVLCQQQPLASSGYRVDLHFRVAVWLYSLLTDFKPHLWGPRPLWPLLSLIAISGSIGKFDGPGLGLGYYTVSISGSFCVG